MIPGTAQVRDDPCTVEAWVTIKRPVDIVFAFYRDFRNLPRFLGDVMAVEPIDPARSRWTIQGPFGFQLHWITTVTEERTNEMLRYQAGLAGTVWEMHFAPGRAAGSTDIREVMTAPLGRVARAALALIGKFPAEEVSANLHRLKQVLETGRATDTRYAVPGKFRAE
jgi:uncharacterized membrane protein